MTTAIIGIVGVLLGALTTQLGAFLSDRRQDRNEAARSAHTEKTAAYEGTLRYLLRAANRRSELVTINGLASQAALSKEGTAQMFEDLVDAQFWLHMLVVRCGNYQKSRISQSAELIDQYVDEITSYSSGKRRMDEFFFGTLPPLKQAIITVIDCAREDSRSAIGLARRPA